MALVENFYRCTDCQGNRFEKKESLVLKHDPDYVHVEDYLKREALPMIREIRYFCSKCGKELNRQQENEKRIKNNKRKE